MMNIKEAAALVNLASSTRKPTTNVLEISRPGEETVRVSNFRLLRSLPGTARIVYIAAEGGLDYEDALELVAGGEFRFV